MPASTRPASPNTPGIINADRDPKTVRAALLIRLSEWVDGTTSVERQRQDGIALIERNGWSFDADTDIYEDVDISGWKEGVRRPGLEALLARLDEYDVIVFWKLDRVFRSVKRFLAFLEECEEAHTGLVSVQEAFLDTTTPIGRLIALVLMAIAEMESTNTSIRVRSARDFFARQGRRLSFAPFGWRLRRDDNGRTTTMELDPIRSAVLAAIVEEFLAGASVRAIIDGLNDRQVPAARGGAWHESTIRRLLSNPVLIGQHVHRGQVVLDEQGVPITPHEPLLDLFTWTNLQEELRRRQPHGRRARRDQRLLRGLLYCSTCGGTLRPSSTEGTVTSTYDCWKNPSAPRPCTGPNCISQRHLDAYVTEWLFGYLTDEVMTQAAALRDQERQMLNRPSPDQERRQRLSQALDRLEEDRQAGLYEGELATARYRAQHRDLMNQLAALTPEPSPLSNLTGLPHMEGPLETAWPALPRETQNRILHAVIERIDISPRDPKLWRRFDPNRVHIVPRCLDAELAPISVDTEMQKAAS